jgi:hypothetical protein
MPDGFSAALGAVVQALYLLASIYIYLALVRQISARNEVVADETERTFGLPEVFLALVFATLFAYSAVADAPSSTSKMVMGSRELIAHGLLSAAFFVFIAAFLKLRGFNVSALAGFARVRFWRTLITGVVLLFASYPLMVIVDTVTRRFIGGEPSTQPIIELFNESATIQQRVLMIVLAVAVAPLVEEFVFRFFLYGVVKQYLGRFAGLITNSILFAAAHGHAPSAAPLFVLGACFTLAYEWSGSILVAMTMHALFNSLTLTALAFPELVGQ